MDLEYNDELDDDFYYEDPLENAVYDSPLETLEAGLYFKKVMEELQQTNPN